MANSTTLYALTDLTKELNPAQFEAVQTTDQNLLVLAGAGSGKTRVITYKIIHLIQNLGIPPYAILAITFTNKAASEMKERVFHQIDDTSQRGLHVRTFHSFGAMLLRTFAHHLPPYDSKFTIADDDDQKRTLKELTKDDHLDDHQVKSLHRQISSWKNQGLFPNDDPNLLSEYLTGEWDPEEAARYYQRYQRYLANHNLLDFDDLIVLPTELIKKSEDCRRFVYSRWKYLLIDEYQDTNLAQEKLIESFAAGGVFLTAVGDDDQSIYAFRGANIENIFDFPKKYQKVKVIKLEENYRSTQPILELANDVIKNNPRIYDKVLRTLEGEGSRPHYECFYNDYAECQWIVSKIKLIKRETAIFYRSNYQSRLIEEHLIQNHIPYQIIGGLKFYQRKEIKDIIAYLNVVFNPRDIVSLRRIINFPTRSLGKASQEKIFYHLEREENINLIEYTGDEVLLTSLSAKARKSLIAFRKMILDLRTKSDDTDILTFLKQLLEVSQIFTDMENISESTERENRLGNVDQFLQSAQDFQRANLDATMVDFLHEVMLRSDADDLETKTESVKLMTIHNAKGLEFERVFVIGMEEESFPHTLSMDSSFGIEEERRLFYVAITRAKQELYLSGCEQKMKFGRVTPCRVSRFITETDEAHLSGRIPEKDEAVSEDEADGFYADPEYDDEHPYF